MLNLLILSAMVTAAGNTPSAGSWFTTNFGLSLVAPSPYLAVGAEYGVSAWDGLVGVGVETQGFWFPPNREISVGLSLGTYVRLAPVPGDIGRRFYLHGKLNRTVATGAPTFNAFGAGGGLGYRQPLDRTPLGGPGYWYLETGLQRAFLFHYGEALFLVDALKTGITF